VQETCELLDDLLTAMKSQVTSESEALLVLVECGFVELVKTMWQQRLRQTLDNQHNECLPHHIASSLWVTHCNICLYG